MNTYQSRLLTLCDLMEHGYKRDPSMESMSEGMHWGYLKGVDFCRKAVEQDRIVDHENFSIHVHKWYESFRKLTVPCNLLRIEWELVQADFVYDTMEAVKDMADVEWVEFVANWGVK